MIGMNATNISGAGRAGGNGGRCGCHSCTAGYSVKVRNQLYYIAWVAGQRETICLRAHVFDQVPAVEGLQDLLDEGDMLLGLLDDPVEVFGCVLVFVPTGPGGQAAHELGPLLKRPEGGPEGALQGLRLV